MSAYTDDDAIQERTFYSARLGTDFACEFCELPFPLGWPARCQDDNGGEFCGEVCRVGWGEDQQL